MKRGFTLLELSIVLVILGLLIGGILVGQSLIESRKLNKTISKITQYAVAHKIFLDRYKQLPGDSNQFSPSGNNDGRIRGRWGNAYYHDEEMGAYWNHLSQGVSLTEFYEPAGVAYTTYVEAGVNYPSIPLNEDASITAISTGTGWWNQPFTIDEPVYWIAELSKTQLRDDNDGTYNWALTPLQAQNLDSKIDDGSPWIGKVVSAGGGNGVMHDNANWNCVTWAATAATREYRIGDGSKKCTLMMKIDYMAGLEK